jgi:hypothetical protein
VKLTEIARRFGSINRPVAALIAASLRCWQLPDRSLHSLSMTFQRFH